MERKSFFAVIQIIVIYSYLGMIAFVLIDQMLSYISERLMMPGNVYYSIVTMIGLVFWASALIWLFMFLFNKANRVLSKKNILIIFLVVLSVLVVTPRMIEIW